MTTTPSAPQFCWSVLGRGDHSPPVPKRGARYGPDATCCLCGGDTGGVGWPRASLPATFTNWNLCAAPASWTICQSCMALASGETWAAYAVAHPDMGLKYKHPLSWRSYSHRFAASGHECPQRPQLRALLLDPPAPPFVLVVAESGQKHLLFRAAVAHDRERFPVQVEEDRVYVDRRRFAACLTAFERLYALGFSKDSILRAEYHPAQLLKVGLPTWRAAEAAFAPWRRREVGLVRLAHYCAQKGTP